MGVIGFPRRDLLYEVKWWEVLSIIRGYNLKHRDLWSATRWQTYQILGAVCGSNNLRENNIYCAKDLIEFPWEDDDNATNNGVELSDEEIAELQADMARLNAKA